MPGTTAASRRETEGAVIPSPLNNGFDKVTRLVDTISLMKRQGHITQREVEAAEIFREAFDVLHGGMTCTLNPDNVGGASSNGRTPSQGAIWAAEKDQDARFALGVVDYAILKKIVGEGRSIDDLAKVKGSKRSTQRQRTLVSDRLREGLITLAEKWMPSTRMKGSSRIRVYAPDKLTVGEAVEIKRSKVALAEPGSVTITSGD